MIAISRGRCEYVKLSGAQRHGVSSAAQTPSLSVGVWRWLLPLQAAAGFSRVISLIQASRKPVVGHNMLFDLIYVLNIFVADFPAWPDFKAAADVWFPGGIYDTKHLTHALEARHQARSGGNGGGAAAPLFDSTTLGDLYEALVEGRGADGAGGQWRTLLDRGAGDGCAARAVHAVSAVCAVCCASFSMVNALLYAGHVGCYCGCVHACMHAFAPAVS